MASIQLYFQVFHEILSFKKILNTIATQVIQIGLFKIEIYKSYRIMFMTYDHVANHTSTHVSS